MVNVNEYKVQAENTLQEVRFELNEANNNSIPALTYTLPIATTPRGPGELGGTPIALDKPVNNKTFSLSGKTESGNIEFEAFERFDPASLDSVYNDRSYDPAADAHTLDELITALKNSTVTGSDDEALKLKNRFQQDSNNTYVVRTVKEQRIWFKEFVHNPGLTTSWTLFGGEYDYRTIDSNDNNAGTPIFVQNTDIEPTQNNEARGIGTLQFNVGGRL